MHQIKIDNFLRDYPDESFPRYVSLTPEIAEEVKGKLLANFSAKNFDELIKSIEVTHSESSVTKFNNSTNEDFGLVNFLSDKGLMPGKSIYLHWIISDELDEMNIQDLNDRFSDIWYPSSDDLNIFDESFSWIAAIRHDGLVSLMEKITVFTK